MNYQANEDNKLSISDKVVGLFTEPSTLFSNLSKQRPRSIDWAIPLVLLIIIAIGVQFLVLYDPVLKQQAVQERLEYIEKMINDNVEQGKMTQGQADQQLDIIAEQLDQQMSAEVIMSIVFIIVISLIFFFAATGLYVLIVKFGLKGTGGFQEGLTAYGLPGYIMLLQLIITIILMLYMEDIKIGTDFAKILGYDVQEFSGYLLSYIDPFKIWFYIVVGIAFAKMFKSEKTGSYVFSILGVWFVLGISFFGLAQVIPFLKFMIR